jgi:hypothetical protein
MSESLKDAIITAEKSDSVKELRSQGYFLNSGISILAPDQEKITNWILTYFDPKSKEVVQVFVNEGGIDVKKPDVPVSPNPNELRLSDIKTNGDKMFAKAKEEFAKQRKPLSQVIITIQREKLVNWKFNFVTKTLEIIQVSIDATSGAVLSTNVTSLTRQS